ncbi:MAG TPA: polysaccharide biosynthesis tyrosine autokinase, partial [Phycisphaerae bacterium]
TQAADGTAKAASPPQTDLEIAEVLLPLEMKQYIENDYTLRGLLSSKMSWEQEKAGLIAGATGLNTPAQYRSKEMEIDARIAKIDEQVNETRSKLKTDALARTEKQLEDEAGKTAALADYIRKARDLKSDEVKGYALVVQEFQGKYDQLIEMQNSVNKMRDEYTLANANRFTDDTRIQQMLNDPAEPDAPSWPKWYMFIPMGTAAGLGLSAMLAYLLVLTDTRIRTPRDISRNLQLPVLGFVPDEGDDRNLRGDVETAIINSPASMCAEAFRQIRSHVTAQTAHNPVNTMVVASIAPGGGGTTVAANLAASMALNDLRVLVIDANFYRPSFNRLFKDLPAEGLTNVIANPQSLSTAVMPHPELARLHVMGVGTQLTGASSEVFEGKSFRELLEQLKSKYDLIIFDGAPLNLVSDSLSLAARVDAVIPVVRAGEVSRGMVTRVRDQIRGVHGNLLGFILNAAQASNTGYFKENYRTFYRYAGKGSRNSGKA